jgi:dihydrodipicolinate synthase/N-acetylneuraminate lyase
LTIFAAWSASCRTPGTPDADRWDAVNTINLPETEKMVRGVVEAGTDVIMTTGTFGQGASLLWEELRDFVDCVVQTTAKRRPIFAGVTTLNTRDTIRRGRELIALGADGLFLGRPMWVALDDEGIVEYYADLAEAIPGVPFIIYDNPQAFKCKISKDAYRELCKNRQIVASKHASTPELDGNLAEFGDRIRILPLENQWFRLAKAHPDLALACWSGGIACAPAPTNVLSRAILARDWGRAEQVAERIAWAVKPMLEGGLGAFGDYSIQLGRIRFKEAGFIDPGPTRKPYTKAPAQLVAGSEECGRRWASLQQEFRGVAVR